MTFLNENAVLVALIWMILANVIAIGPNLLKTPALVIMLITWAPIFLAVLKTSGWLIAFPILLLMLIQMRWALYFIRRLLRHYGILETPDDA